MTESKAKIVRRRGTGAQTTQSDTESAEFLGLALDQLNARLLEVEQRLRRYGTAARVHFPEVGVGGSEFAFLGFEKYVGHWQLVLIIEDEFTEHSQTEPLRSATRAIRLMAVEHLPSLVDAVKAESRRQADAALAALSKVEAILQTLPAGDAAGDDFDEF